MGTKLSEKILAGADVELADYGATEAMPSAAITRAAEKKIAELVRGYLAEPLAAIESAFSHGIRHAQGCRALADRQGCGCNCDLINVRRRAAEALTLLKSTR